MSDSILTSTAGDRLLSCPDGRRLSVPGDPACCAPSQCPEWLRFVPCGTFDCIGEKTPGTGPPVWLCRAALCVNLQGPSGGGVTIVGRPNLVVIIGGVCYRHDADTPGVPTPDLVPPGEAVLADLVFTCGTNGCAGCASSTTGWARARPCDPAYSGRQVWFCRPTLLRPCVVTGAFGDGANNCHVYRADAPIGTPPANAILVSFPADWPWDNAPGNYGSCCRCGCTPGPPLQPIACPNAGPWPNGCCQPDQSRSYARIDYYSEEVFGGSPVQRQVQTVRGFGPALAVPCVLRRSFFVGSQEFADPPLDITLGVPCPAAPPVDPGGVWTYIIYQNPGLTLCNEYRAVDRYQYEQRFVPPGSPEQSRHVRMDVRLFQREAGPCRNNDCLGAWTPIPRPPGEAPEAPPPGGGRSGAGSRPVDPMTAAIIEQQSRGGGCRGCGDGWAG